MTRSSWVCHRRTSRITSRRSSSGTRRRGRNCRSRNRIMRQSMSGGPAGHARREPCLACSRLSIRPGRPADEHTKAPEGTGGDLRSTGPEAANKSAVPGRRRVPRSPALRPANLVPGTVPRITPRTGLAVQPAPSGKTKCTGGTPATTTGLSTNLQRIRPKVIPELVADVDGLWIHSRGEVPRMGRLIARIIAAQDGWATTARGLQPPLAQRPLPTDPPDQGFPQRRRGSATRSMPPRPTSRSGRSCSSSCSTSSASPRRPTSRSSRPSCSCSRRP